MSDAAALKAAAEAAEAAVTQQGDAVRALKASLKQGEATKVRRERKRGKAFWRAVCFGRRPINRWVLFFFIREQLCLSLRSKKHRACSGGT